MHIAVAIAALEVLQGDRLFLTMGAGKFTVAAVNKKSGEIIWKTEDAEKQAYVSPFTTTLAGREQLILGAGREVQGLSLEDGTVLWRDDWRVSFDNHIAQPIVLDEQHLFVSAGYGTGCALYKITDNNGTYKPEQIWFNKELKNKFTSSVLHEGYIYGLDDAGGFVAQDAGRHHGDAALDDVEVAVADARGRRAGQDLVGAGLVDVHLFDLEGGVELA